MTMQVPSVEGVRSWPVTVDVPTAGRAFGIGRDQAYRLAKEGTFPVPVLRIGRVLRVSRASVLAALGMPDTPQPLEIDSPH
jgi:predicted DNA-binding transcriptional regulator AlpA